MDELKALIASLMEHFRNSTKAFGDELDGLRRETQSWRQEWDRELGGQVAASKRLPLGGFAPGEGETAGFSGFGDFISAIRFKRGADARLVELETKGLDGASGGFLIPTAYDYSLTAAIAEASIVRPRARVFGTDQGERGGRPDAPLEVPALDYSHGLHAGVLVGWLGAGGFPASDPPAWRQIRFEPSELGAITRVPDKLLRNTAEAEQAITSLFVAAVAAAEDEAFFRGDGVSKPLGLFGHPATLTVAREGAGTIGYADLTAMLAAARPGGSPAWVISHTALPALMQITLPGGFMPAFVPDASQGMVGRIFGYPVAEWLAAPVLGDTGDVQLLDLSWYGIRPGLGTRIDMSNVTGTNFQDAFTSFRVLRSLDGQPLVTAPMTLADGESVVSPFIQLTDPEGGS